MIIAGLEKLSLIDYPNHLSAIVFTQGCNFRCHYCYNPMLVWPKRTDNGKYGQEGSPYISEESLLSFLKERQGKLNGVVITGGEPTLHKDLPSFIEKIRKLGYDIKLDTNGTNPNLLKKLIEDKLLDYIAMDFKAPISSYQEVVNVELDFLNIKKSAKIIRESGLDYEFRTTVVPQLIDKAKIEEMGKLLQGSEKWFLQKFKSETDLINDKYRNLRSYNDKEMDELVKVAKKYVNLVKWR
ncbi:MAG TPA: anaerobic ribonucleoside-triphosphate reductase activating protein [Patescibacteria group bacterium]|nr:anaerobic ribonucleoside-triphosphate reductase activating protein [Patescibacteria group bacterium]